MALVSYLLKNALSIRIFISFAIVVLLAIALLPTKFIVNNEEGSLELVITTYKKDKINPVLTKERDVWNNKVLFKDIKSVEIKKLTKEDKKNYIGTKFKFNNYLVIQLKNNTTKYMYISMFFNKQVSKLLETIEKGKD